MASPTDIFRTFVDELAKTAFRPRERTVVGFKDGVAVVEVQPTLAVLNALSAPGELGLAP